MVLFGDGGIKGDLVVVLVKMLVVKFAVEMGLEVNFLNKILKCIYLINHFSNKLDETTSQIKYPRNLL